MKDLRCLFNFHSKGVVRSELRPVTPDPPRADGERHGTVIRLTHGFVEFDEVCSRCKEVLQTTIMLRKDAVAIEQFAEVKQ